MDHPFRSSAPPPPPTGRRVRLARQVWLRSTPSGFAVGGYDQWALISVGLALLLASGYWWLPLLFEAPRSALTMAAWVPVGWAFFRLTLTFELRCEGGLFVVSRRFVGVPWWRRKMPVKDVDIVVDGNGDYGEDGGWPARESCTLSFHPAPGDKTPHVDVQLGPAWAAHEIKQAIERERERLIGTA